MIKTQSPRVISSDRAFVFGGSYGNLHATKAVLARADALGFRTDEIIFTGDLVAYCGQPQETVDLIRSRDIASIMGNCEESLGNGAADCGCGFEEGSQCSVLSDEWYRFCGSKLNDDTKAWMSTLPRSIILEIGEYRLLCTHGTPEVINQFVFASDIAEGRYPGPAGPNWQGEGSKPIDGFVVGHSGIPFVSEVSGRLWLNSGAAGMPANDGTPRVWCATLEVDNGQLRAQTHAIEYDYEGAAATMAEVGLANGYMDCLSSGVWPSQDVLPETEKNRTGIPLEPQALEFSKSGIPAAA